MMSDEPTRRYTLARLSRGSVSLLESISEGDWVEYSDGNYGLVVGKVDGPVEWPTGDGGTKKVEDQGERKNILIVARETGGSKPFTADEVEKVNRDTVIGDESEMPDNPEEDIDEAEMARREFQYKVVAELINVPGVDDPEVGWDSYPDSWEKSEKPNRLILLDAWSSLGGTFTGCMGEIGSKRICGSMKDEVLGTERWRNRF